MDRILRRLAMASLLLCGCVVSTSAPEGVLYSCGADADCPDGHYCELRLGLCRSRANPLQDDGSACSKNGDCASSACVGARCCATACEAQAASTCGTTGECLPDGSACARWAEQTVCAEPVCADAQFTGQGVCSGGSCQRPGTLACPGSVPCQDAKSCKGACVGDGDCLAGLFCHPDSGSATGTVCRKQAAGERCTADGDCASTHCVGGTCCSQACAASAQSSCGETGQCRSDGLGCLLWPQGTACKDTTCVAGVVTGSRSCDGRGSCAESGGSSDCPNGLSCADAATCRTQCTAHSDCRTGFFCDGGSCAPTKALGSACEEGEECSSGHCPTVGGAGGVCCLGGCAGEAEPTCGRTGLCKPDGSGCALWSAATPCGTAACDAAKAELTLRLCDGTGSCGTSKQVCPDGLGCADATSCRSACQQDADCVTGLFCLPDPGGAKRCRKKNDGEPCATNGDCSKSQCVQGTCCASACLPQAASTCGFTGRCLADGSGCELWAKETECRAPTCTVASYTAAGQCPGGGAACPGGTATACEGNYGCNASGEACTGSCPGGSWNCNGACTVGAHTGCAPGHWCREGDGGRLVCVAGKQLYGETCDASTDCNYDQQAGAGNCDSNLKICCEPGKKCCRTPADCGPVHQCAIPTVCGNQDTDFDCTSFGCVPKASTVNSCDGVVSKVCPNNLAPAVCPNTTCPSDCAPGNVDDDALCATGYFCSNKVCTLGADDGQACTKDRACKSGKCLNGFCCNPGPTGRTCCVDDAEAALVCPPICTEEALCQGKAAKCIQSNCSNVPNPAVDDDRGCNGHANPAAVFACTGAPIFANLYVYCWGEKDQAPSARCSPPGTSGCAYTSGANRSDVFCKAPTHCVITQSGGTYSGLCQ